MHEVNFLKRRDKNNRVKFTDIVEPGYNPDDMDNGRVTYEVGMKNIHGVLQGGEVISGVRVFEEVYSAVGLGWVWSFTRIPGVMDVAERLYSKWAAWRMWITGRPELEEVFRRRRRRLEVLKEGGKFCEIGSEQRTGKCD